MSGLSASTLYHYRVKSKDAAGNLATSDDFTFTTMASPDTIAPSVPANLSVSAVSSSQINLTWTASTDNVGVTGYKVFRGGSQVGTATGTSFSNTGLSPSTAYNYTVSGYDAAGLRCDGLAEARLRPSGYDAAAFAAIGLAEPKQA